MRTILLAILLAFLTSSLFGQSPSPSPASSKFDSDLLGGTNPILNDQEKAGVEITAAWRDKSLETMVGHAGVNASVEFRYGESYPTIVCAVLQVSDLELEKGEQITHVNLGDSTRWSVESAVSGSGSSAVDHLIIKQRDKGLSTSLIVTTDRRTYHLLLVSDQSEFMHDITFVYPATAPAVAAAQQAAGNASGYIPAAKPPPTPFPTATPVDVATPDAEAESRRKAFYESLYAPSAVQDPLITQREQSAAQQAMTPPLAPNLTMPPLPGAAPTPLDPHVLSTAGQADRWKLNNRIEKPASKYILQTGWLIPALMISGMESQLPGSIIAQVSQDIFDSPSGKYLLIPKGTRIFGEYANSIAFGQSRIFVAWQRLIFPNGNTLDISAMPGADSEGEAGFHDLTDSHLLTIFGSALLMSAISGATALSQPQQTFSNAPNLESTLSAALGQQLGAATTALLEKNLSVPPSATPQDPPRVRIQCGRSQRFDLRSALHSSRLLTQEKQMQSIDNSVLDAKSLRIQQLESWIELAISRPAMPRELRMEGLELVQDQSPMARQAVERICPSISREHGRELSIER